MKQKQFKIVIFWRVFPLVMAAFFSCSFVFFLTRFFFTGKLFRDVSSFDGIFWMTVLLGFGVLFIFGAKKDNQTLFITEEGIGYKSITGKEVVFIRWNEIKEVDAKELRPKNIAEMITRGITIKRDKKPGMKDNLIIITENFSDQDTKEIIDEIRKNIPAEKFVARS